MIDLFECYLDSFDNVFTKKQITGLNKLYKKLMMAIVKTNINSKIKILPFAFIIRKLLEHSNCKDENILALFPYPINTYDKYKDIMILDEYENIWYNAAIELNWISTIIR